MAQDSDVLQALPSTKLYFFWLGSSYLTCQHNIITKAIYSYSLPHIYLFIFPYTDNNKLY